MNQYKNPKWWTTENDSAWERVKEAFKRDWDQTKHDMGGDEPDTDQDVNNTLKQAAGKEAIPPRGEPTYEDAEPAYRFGYGARSYYEEEHPDWDEEVEGQLREDWSATYPDRSETIEEDIEAIRYGWEYHDGQMDVDEDEEEDDEAGTRPYQRS
jgi:hypothetical protein